MRQRSALALERTQKIKTADVRFVKGLYPRHTDNNAALERYRAAIEFLPAIVVTGDGVLVDGYHRWQAHLREGIDEIEAEDLGDLPDVEMLKESLRRNARLGVQLTAADK